MESQRYYLIQYGERVGPYSREELKTKVKSRTDKVWSEELVIWTPLNQVVELLDVCHSIPPDFNEDLNHREFNLSEWLHKNYKIVASLLVLFILYIIFIEVPRREEISLKQQAIAKYEAELKAKEQERIELIKEQQRQEEITSAKAKLSELNVALSVANDRYARANEFHFLRTSEERERDLKNALTEIERIELKRSELLKIINQ